MADTPKPRKWETYSWLDWIEKLLLPAIVLVFTVVFHQADDKHHQDDLMRQQTDREIAWVDLLVKGQPHEKLFAMMLVRLHPPNKRTDDLKKILASICDGSLGLELKGYACDSDKDQERSKSSASDISIEIARPDQQDAAMH